MWNVLRFEDAESIVLAMSLKHLVLNIHATRFAHYARCHSDALTVCKSIESGLIGKALKEHERRDGQGHGSGVVRC